MRLPEHHIKRAKEFTLIIIIIFVLFGAAYVIAAYMSDDIEAKNIAICPSDDRAYIDANSYEESGNYEPECITEGYTFHIWEPNEPKITDDQQKIIEWQKSFHYIPIEICKHENRITCTVYGCGCWSCMDCDEHSEGTKIYFKDKQ